MEIQEFYYVEWNGTDQPFPDFTNMNQISSFHCLVARVMFVNLDLKVYDFVYAAGLQVCLTLRR